MTQKMLADVFKMWNHATNSPNLILIFDESFKNKSDLTIGWFKQEFID